MHFTLNYNVKDIKSFL